MRDLNVICRPTYFLWALNFFGQESRTFQRWESPLEVGCMSFGRRNTLIDMEEEPLSPRATLGFCTSGLRVSKYPTTDKSRPQARQHMRFTNTMYINWVKGQRKVKCETHSLGCPCRSICHVVDLMQVPQRLRASARRIRRTFTLHYEVKIVRSAGEDEIVMNWDRSADAVMLRHTWVRLLSKRLHTTNQGRRSFNAAREPKPGPSTLFSSSWLEQDWTFFSFESVVLGLRYGRQIETMYSTCNFHSSIKTPSSKNPSTSYHHPVPSPNTAPPFHMFSTNCSYYD